MLGNGWLGGGRCRCRCRCGGSAGTPRRANLRRRRLRQLLLTTTMMIEERELLPLLQNLLGGETRRFALLGVLRHLLVRGSVGARRRLAGTRRAVHCGEMRICRSVGGRAPEGRGKIARTARLATNVIMSSLK